MSEPTREPNIALPCHTGGSCSIFKGSSPTRKPASGASVER